MLTLVAAPPVDFLQLNRDNTFVEAHFKMIPLMNAVYKRVATVILVGGWDNLGRVHIFLDPGVGV